MTLRGMDVDRVDALAAQLDIQAKLIDSVVGVVDGAVRALTDVWFGENLNVFHGAWVGGQRAQAHGASADIAAALHTLRVEIAAQRATSAGAGGGVPGFSGSFPTPKHASPSDMLAFAKDAEQRGPNQAILPGKEHIKLPEGWSVASNADLKKLGIDPKTLHDPRTGFDATIYSNGHGGYVVSFAGSDGNPLDPYNKDWGGNGGDIDQASSAIPGESTQVEQAANLAYQLKSRAGADNLVFTGHSLGGREAAIASVVTGSKAVTFNPTGTTTDDLLYANALAGRSEGLGGMVGDFVSRGAVSHSSADHNSDVTNYVISDDVARATHLDVAGQYLGRVSVISTTTPNPISAHHLSNFDDRL